MAHLKVLPVTRAQHVDGGTGEVAEHALPYRPSLFPRPIVKGAAQRR